MIRKTKHPDNRAARRALKFKKDTFAGPTDYIVDPKFRIDTKDIPNDSGSKVPGEA